MFTPLREHAAEPAVKRVENILTLLVSADTLAREQREQKRILERAGKDWHRPLRASLNASSHTWELLNGELKRYPTLALAQGAVGRFYITDRPVTASRGRWAYWERWAVGVLLNLARKPGELSLVRRCSECSHWFYANRAHQQFCGVACRRRHTAQNPEFKEKRARYMREFYRPIIEKEKDARAKRQAGWVFSGKSKKGGN